VAATHESPYGPVTSAWTLGGGRLELAVTVPPNARATVVLPKAKLAGVTEGSQALAVGPGITGVRQDGETVVVEIGSGRYRFGYKN